MEKKDEITVKAGGESRLNCGEAAKGKSSLSNLLQSLCHLYKNIADEGIPPHQQHYAVFYPMI